MQDSGQISQNSKVWRIYMFPRSCNFYKQKKNSGRTPTLFNNSMRLQLRRFKDAVQISTETRLTMLFTLTLPGNAISWIKEKKKEERTNNP